MSHFRGNVGHLSVNQNCAKNNLNFEVLIEMRKDFYDKENLNGRETIFEPFGDGGRSKVIVKDLPGWGTNHRCETCGEVRSLKNLSSEQGSTDQTSRTGPGPTRFGKSRTGRSPDLTVRGYLFPKRKFFEITQNLDSGQCDQFSSSFFEKTCR